VFSLLSDIVRLAGGAESWSTVAYYTMAGGIGGALLAALPGLIDLLSLPRQPRKTALVHMTINLTVVALYAINLWLRTGATVVTTSTFWLSVVAIALLVVSGWLGGKLVYELGVAVDTRTPADSRASSHTMADVH
jgi:uncharacterized membrane protein